MISKESEALSADIPKLIELEKELNNNGDKDELETKLTNLDFKDEELEKVEKESKQALVQANFAISQFKVQQQKKKEAAEHPDRDQELVA